MGALATWFRSWMHRLNPIHALERQTRVLLAAELDRSGPVSRSREEETSGVRAELLLLLQSIARVRPVGARREDSSFSGLDRLTGLLVLHYDSIDNGLQRAWRHRIRRDVERVAIRPEPELPGLRIRAAARENCGCQRQQREAAHHQ